MRNTLKFLLVLAFLIFAMMYSAVLRPSIDAWLSAREFEAGEMINEPGGQVSVPVLLSHRDGTIQATLLIDISDALDFMSIEQPPTWRIKVDDEVLAQKVRGETGGTSSGPWIN
jgi:hypothetical protein